MDRAINKETGEMLDAINLHDNSSHLNPLEEKWKAPKDKILNWDEEEMEGREEEPVHYVTATEYPHWNPEKAKKKITIYKPPCFALYPNSPAKTVKETPEHKALKKFIFNTLIIGDLKLVYATLKKKNSYKKYLKISELKKEGYLDLDNYSIEVSTRGYKTLRADILLPFKKHHEFLGNGISFEIQIQPQSEKKTFDRSIKWALNKYSVVWLFGKDFNYNKDLTEIELKKDEVKMFSYINELYYGKKSFCKKLDDNVKEKSRLLDLKLKETINKSEKELEKNWKEGIQIGEFIEEKYIDIKKKIEGFFGYKIKEISEKFSEDVAGKVQNDFFNNHKEELEQMIRNYLIEYVKEIELDRIQEEIERIIDWDKIILNVEYSILNKIEKKLEVYYSWKRIIQNTPICPYCKNNSLKLVKVKKGTPDEKWAFVCDEKMNGCNKWIALPYELEKKELKGEDHEI